MKRYTGKKFPNGLTKSRLLEVYLSYRDFDCEPDTYLFDLTVIRRGEINGVEHCSWIEDENGHLYVSDLSLADDTKWCRICADGFKLVPMTIRPFISYAKEDLPSALRLHEELTAVGVRPWLDEKSLLPGQYWEIEIESAIAECNFFIALLSSRSVAKRGYVQKEIRRALEALEKFPERDIFLIPARLDECEPSHSALLDIQRVDLFPNWDDGLQSIMRTIGMGDDDT